MDDDTEYSSYSREDDGHGDRRRLTFNYDEGYEGAFLTFTVTAQVPSGQDPVGVMADVEGLIEAHFVDQEASSADWLARAAALGADIPADTHIVFAEPHVESDSVHVSRPGDFIDHHYHSNGNVRIGAWIGASLAGVALVLSAKYGMKAYGLQRDASEIEQKKATEWANVEEVGGDMTQNPLAMGGTGAEVECASVRLRSNSGPKA